jgi:hypothetical protein
MDSTTEFCNSPKTTHFQPPNSKCSQLVDAFKSENMYVPHLPATISKHGLVPGLFEQF